MKYSLLIINYGPWAIAFIYLCWLFYWYRNKKLRYYFVSYTEQDGNFGFANCLLNLEGRHFKYPEVQAYIGNKSGEKKKVVISFYKKISKAEFLVNQNNGG